ncbi:hypothetical protein T8K17_17995 [Thalassobaculum sp. OXR-137]|uniref:hypothetical protein n=1 Tax=Thalassobaculum sp. OXR-137 TaxID=3100173 RepID=UPI002AC99870|nr:hypothetical protein [Thalassobaculum sp. OXR-137]WPZ33123.1 hypothetical protein T8K17_17995 [Thalassobaculum sp. OXR-137]
MSRLPATVARETGLSTIRLDLERGPYGWLAYSMPDRYSRLPTLAEEDEIRRDLVAATEPVEVSELERAIARLVAAYPQRGAADIRGYVIGLAEHLAGFPADVVARACWEIVHAKAFLPAVAEVVALAESYAGPRRHALRALDAVDVERERRRKVEAEQARQEDSRQRWRAAETQVLDAIAAAKPGHDAAEIFDRLGINHRIRLKLAAIGSDDDLVALVDALEVG